MSMVHECRSKREKHRVKQKKWASHLEVVDNVFHTFQILCTFPFIMCLVKAFSTNQILGEETSGTTKWAYAFSKDSPPNIVAAVFVRVSLIVDGVIRGCIGLKGSAPFGAGSRKAIFTTLCTFQCEDGSRQYASRLTLSRTAKRPQGMVFSRSNCVCVSAELPNIN